MPTDRGKSLVPAGKSDIVLGVHIRKKPKHTLGVSGQMKTASGYQALEGEKAWLEDARTRSVLGVSSTDIRSQTFGPLRRRPSTATDHLALDARNMIYQRADQAGRLRRSPNATAQARQGAA